MKTITRILQLLIILSFIAFEIFAYKTDIESESKSKEYNESSISIRAQVSQIVWSKFDDMASLRLRYKIEENVYECESRQSWSKPTFKVGDTVTVSTIKGEILCSMDRYIYPSNIQFTAHATIIFVIAFIAILEYLGSKFERTNRRQLKYYTAILTPYLIILMVVLYFALPIMLINIAIIPMIWVGRLLFIQIDQNSELSVKDKRVWKVAIVITNILGIAAYIDKHIK